MSSRAALIQWPSNRRTVSGVPSASMRALAPSSIQKPKLSSTLNDVLPLGVSTITTFFVRHFRYWRANAESDEQATKATRTSARKAPFIAARLGPTLYRERGLRLFALG